MTRVQLLVTDESNRDALETLLADRYEVIVDETLQQADCYVIDDQSLPAYRDRLDAHKRARHPTFCPVVLIRRAETRITEPLPEADGTTDPPLIDETVTAPVTKQILVRRIENLAVRREQSVALARKYEHVEARFEALFAAIPDPAFVLDPDGTLIAINDEFCRAFGTHRSEIRGQPLGAVDGLDLDPDRLTGPTDESRPAGRTVQYTNAAGLDRDASLSVQTVVVGGEQYTVCILTDVTELHNKTDRLEEFANVLAHDLRNPLQVAQMRLSVLREEFPAAADHLDSVDGSLHRIQDLIEKLLTVAKTGRTDPETAPVGLGDSVETSWEAIDSTGSALVVSVDDDATAMANRDQLRQLFETLFENAVEHGGTDVTVEVGELSEGFYIADDGSGLPEGKDEDVFRMGYSTHTNGNGLGLNIAAEIADAHGWNLSMTDSDDGGVRVEITGVGRE